MYITTKIRSKLYVVFIRQFLKRVVLWYGNVRLSVCRSVRPSVRNGSLKIRRNRNNKYTERTIYRKKTRITIQEEEFKK